ncbi:MAG: twitching motility protein PilT, partial [Burkholderiales bacterium]
LPPSVRAHHERFSSCDACGRVFWEGSHWRRLRGIVDEALAHRAA